MCCAYDASDGLTGVGQFMEVAGYRMGLLQSLYMSGHHIEELDAVTTQCERDNMAYSAKGQLSPRARGSTAPIQLPSEHREQLSPRALSPRHFESSSPRRYDKYSRQLSPLSAGVLQTFISLPSGR